MRALKTTITVILSISGLLLMLWFIMPSVYYTFTYAPVAVSSAVIAFAAFFSSRENQHRFVYIFLPCVLLALLYFVVPYNLQFKPALNIFQQMVMFTAPAMMLTFFLSIDKRYKNLEKLRKAATVFVVGCVVFVFLMTMHELSTNPNVCRALASGDRSDELMALRMRNIGGFGFSYAMGIMEIIVFYYALTIKKKKIKYVYIVLTVIIFLFIIRSQYMTLLILCAVGNLLICLRFAKGTGAKVLIVIAALAILALADPITGFLSKVFVGSKLSDKFYSISGIFGGNGYSSMRTSYIKDCLRSFANNPLVGKFNLINDFETSAISKKSHSTQLKILVDTGLVGSLLYNTYLIYMRSYIAKCIRNVGANPEPFTMCFWFVWMLSWLNPVFQTYELPFALFLAVPLIICYNSERKSTPTVKSQAPTVPDEPGEQ